MKCWLSVKVHKMLSRYLGFHGNYLIVKAQRQRLNHPKVAIKFLL